MSRGIQIAALLAVSLSSAMAGAAPAGRGAGAAPAGRGAGAAPAGRAETIAIVGATVWEQPGVKRDSATVVIRDGKIASVTAGGAAPAGARIIDGKGKVVTAGFIAAYTEVGIAAIDLEPSSVDGRFDAGDDPIHAAFRASDVYDPRAVAVPIARGGGITSVVASPSGGLVSGQAAWFTLGDGAASVAVRAPAAMLASLGAAATRSRSRGMAIERLREVLDDAASYARNKAAYERNQQRHMIAERLDLEALGPVLRGRLPLLVAASSASDIRAALAIARDLRLRVTIVGGTEAWRVAPELAAARVAVLLDPSANLPAELSALDVRDDNAAVLAAAGVDVGVVVFGDGGVGDATFARTLRQLAGMAVSRGLPWDKGLAALTTVPAKIFGVTDRGIVKAGAAADVVMWGGDPLELSTRAEVVIIGGAVQPMVSHQTRLLERYRRLAK